jgi:glycosyl transferase family 25
MEEQFARLGIAAQRIEASTPADVTSEMLGDKGLTTGEVACSLSHAAAWRRLLEDGLSAAVIFEDDAILSPRLPQFLAEIDRFTDAAIIKLECWPGPVLLAGRARTTMDGVVVRRVLSIFLGAASYVISAEAARECLGRPELHKMPVDQFLSGRVGPMLYRRRVLQTVPGLAIQANMFDESPLGPAAISDLEVHRQPRSTLPSPPKTLRRRLFKLYGNICYIAGAIIAFAPGGWLFGSRWANVQFAASADPRDPLVSARNVRPLPAHTAPTARLAPPGRSKTGL